MIFNIEGISNYALTGRTSVYNEDGLAGQLLLKKCAKKVIECLNDIQNIHNALEHVESGSNEYNPSNEELIISNNYLIKISNAKHYVDKFYLLWNEDSVSPIELAGNINKAINEGLTGVYDMCAKILLLDTGLSEELDEVKEYITNSYVDVYDECSLNLLELAGITANNVNELIKVVNTVHTIVNGITSFTDNYNELAEELALEVVEDDNETLTI